MMVNTNAVRQFIVWKKDEARANQNNQLMAKTCFDLELNMEWSKNVMRTKSQIQYFHLSKCQILAGFRVNFFIFNQLLAYKTTYYIWNDEHFFTVHKSNTETLSLDIN